MAELALATMVGGAALNVLFQEIANYYKGRTQADRRTVEEEVARLRRMLTELQTLLIDAEGGQPGGEKWKEELQKIAYEAEDTLDELATRVLQRGVRRHRNQVGICISYKLLKRRMKNVWNRLEQIARERELLRSVAGVADGLLEWRNMPQGPKQKTSSLRSEQKMFGRDEERDKVMRWLLPEVHKSKGIGDQPSEAAEESNYSVLLIVGMAGMGKTTLAQHIFDDKRVQDSFQSSWVHVSNNFDEDWVTKQILESVDGAPGAAVLTNLDAIQRKFKQLLERESKRFLLVLDDVWDVDRMIWNNLKKPLQSCVKGSRVLVTSQNQEIASIMSEEQPVVLAGLPFDAYWPLFKKHAFRGENFDASQRLEEIGKQIAGKMEGSPLAAETLGSQLRSKPDVQNWVEILNSELWHVKQGPYDILPSLKVSFRNLPRHLKPCFLYCSILPKYQNFKGATLVQLWMAQGFVPQLGGNRSMEEIGREYLEDLVGRSFFHSVGDDTYAMHSLIHDLARCILKNQCLWAENFSKSQFGAQDAVRHLSCYFDEPQCNQLTNSRRFNKLRTLLYVHNPNCETSRPTPDVGLHPWEQARSLLPPLRFSCWSRTWVSTPGMSSSGQLLSLSRTPSRPTQMPLQSFASWRCLRVLNLFLCLIHSLPESISNLIHLRYLNISFTRVRKLHRSLTRIYSLQTLVLLGNPDLKQLPEDMNMLINLRHLEADAELVSAISGIGRLCCLQELEGFKVRKDEGHRIAELRDMAELRALSVSKLENVESRNAAEEANMEAKQHLRSLKLEWGTDGAGVSNLRSDDGVLEGLRPHSDLEELTVAGYGGIRSPTWMENGHLQQLTKLHLHHCSGWEALPPLGLLPSLRRLRIEAMANTRRMGHDNFPGGDGDVFPCLEILEIDGMPEWNEWPGTEQCRWFRRLQVLTISGCPMLRRLPPLPLELTELTISNLGLNALPGFWLPINDRREGSGRNNSSLRILSISSCPHLDTLGEGLMASRRLAAPQVLQIVGCEELTVLPGGTLAEFASLESVTIENCPKLFVPEGHPLPSSIKHLRFTPCSASLIDSILLQSRNMTALQSLSLQHDSTQLLLTGEQSQLKGCDGLQNIALREWLSVRSVTAISELEISSCPRVTSIPGEALCRLTALRKLVITACAGLASVGIPELPLLEDLTIEDCPELAFLTSDVPSTSTINGDAAQLICLRSLAQLRISDCPKMRFLGEDVLRHMSTLKELEITGCA